MNTKVTRLEKLKGREIVLAFFLLWLVGGVGIVTEVNAAETTNANGGGLLSPSKGGGIIIPPAASAGDADVTSGKNAAESAMQDFWTRRTQTAIFTTPTYGMVRSVVTGQLIQGSLRLGEVTKTVNFLTDLLTPAKVEIRDVRDTIENGRVIKRTATITETEFGIDPVTGKDISQTTKSFLTTDFGYDVFGRNDQTTTEVRDVLGVLISHRVDKVVAFSDGTVTKEDFSGLDIDINTLWQKWITSGIIVESSDGKGIVQDKVRDFKDASELKLSDTYKGEADEIFTILKQSSTVNLAKVIEQSESEERPNLINGDKELVATTKRRITNLRFLPNSAGGVTGLVGLIKIEVLDGVGKGTIFYEGNFDIGELQSKLKEGRTFDDDALAVELNNGGIGYWGGELRRFFSTITMNPGVNGLPITYSYNSAQSVYRQDDAVLAFLAPKGTGSFGSQGQGLKALDANNITSSVSTTGPGANRVNADPTTSDFVITLSANLQPGEFSEGGEVEIQLTDKDGKILKKGSAETASVEWTIVSNSVIIHILPVDYGLKAGDEFTVKLKVKPFNVAAGELHKQKDGKPTVVKEFTYKGTVPATTTTGGLTTPPAGDAAGAQNVLDADDVFANTLQAIPDRGKLTISMQTRPTAGGEVQFTITGTGKNGAPVTFTKRATLAGGATSVGVELSVEELAQLNPGVASVTVDKMNAGGENPTRLAGPTNITIPEPAQPPAGDNPPAAPVNKIDFGAFKENGLQLDVTVAGAVGDGSEKVKILVTRPNGYTDFIEVAIQQQNGNMPVIVPNSLFGDGKNKVVVQVIKVVNGQEQIVKSEEREVEFQRPDNVNPAPPASPRGEMPQTIALLGNVFSQLASIYNQSSFDALYKINDLRALLPALNTEITSIMNNPALTWEDVHGKIKETALRYADQMIQIGGIAKSLGEALKKANYGI